MIALSFSNPSLVGEEERRCTATVPSNNLALSYDLGTTYLNDSEFPLLIPKLGASGFSLFAPVPV